MKKIKQTSLVVFHETDLPNMASCCPQEECGFSIYRGVLIQWDEDQDERILTFVDSLPDDIAGQLLIAQEHEGSLYLVWKGPVPKAYTDNNGVSVEDDHWSICKSIGN